jgi:penicillin amidase
VFGKNDASTFLVLHMLKLKTISGGSKRTTWLPLDGRLKFTAKKDSNAIAATGARDPEIGPREYKRLDPHTRAICDGFAAGLNYYLRRHPEVKPRLLTKMEPWYPLAFIRYNYYQNGFSFDPALDGADLETADVGEPRFGENQGSNGWVINPSKSATGNAMLFINPHLPFFGSGQVYEGHVHSDEGWNFTGYTRFGFPFPYVGHNDNGGWVSTDNAADLVDVYAETFDDPTRPARVSVRKRVSDRHRAHRGNFGEDGDGGGESQLQDGETHHGPILAAHEGKKLAIRMAKFESDGWLREWYLMTRAKSVAELKRAMGRLTCFSEMLCGPIERRNILSLQWCCPAS